MTNASTGFVFHKKYLDHILEPGAVESPVRLNAIMEMMENSGLGQEVQYIKPLSTPEKAIQSIHEKQHIDLVQTTAHDPDICKLAVSGILTAIDQLEEGKIRNAFCAIRPPGHHALNSGEYGFCFYSNVAIAARYAQQSHGLEKVLIIDWDYHHGNSTEWAFYNDPSVLFFSTHRLMAFPGTGFPEKKGKDEGYGYNINAPLPPGATDRDILVAFEKQLIPVAEDFQPDIIFISAGFDSRKEDLLGDFKITDAGFTELTRIIKTLAKTHAKSRIISVLEGGYNPLGIASAVEAHVKTLLE